MIPVQTNFPPSLARRWRKVMRETPVLMVTSEVSAQWILDQLDDPAKSAKLKDAGWDLKVLRRAAEADKRNASFDRWKLSQQRQQWVYAAMGGALLVLIVFLVCGGCHAPRA